MTLKTLIKNWLPPAVIPIVKRLTGRSETQLLQRYLQGDRSPWSLGYGIYKQDLICQALQDDLLMAQFKKGEILPDGYGIGVDERCVEYPWLFSQLPIAEAKLLDAGSILNHAFLLDQPILQNKDLHILTLAPESNCFWERGISYLFGDLRNIPLKSNFYDLVICLSTLEHIGCDNRLYTKSLTGIIDKAINEAEEIHSFSLAVRELHRVLKPGGSLFLSVPFGKYQYFGGFQQFNSAYLEKTIAAFQPALSVESTFYRYNSTGWQIASEADCKDCEYVEWIGQASRSINQTLTPSQLEPDNAAAARGVACLHLIKPIE